MRILFFNRKWIIIPRSAKFCLLMMSARFFLKHIRKSTGLFLFTNVFKTKRIGSKLFILFIFLQVWVLVNRAYLNMLIAIFFIKTYHFLSYVKPFPIFLFFSSDTVCTPLFSFCYLTISQLCFIVYFILISFNFYLLIFPRVLLCIVLLSSFVFCL